MPFFVPKDRYNRLVEDNARMRGQLEEWEKWRDYLVIAKHLQAQVVELLSTSATGQEIGELAFKAVMTEQIEKARQELIAKYEQNHRKILYERAVQATEATEGPAILEAVTKRLDTDPQLALELRDSARKELTARAKGVVAENVSKSQQTAIDAEVERQMALDHFDVAFALTGELTLDDPAITTHLVRGDMLDIWFKHDLDGQSGLTMLWQKDVNNATGWLVGEPLKKPDHPNYDNYHTTLQLGRTPTRKFVTIGADLRDLVEDASVFRPNHLVAGSPLAFRWETASGKTEQTVPQLVVRQNQYNYSTETQPGLVVATDLRTHDLVFA